MKTHQSRDRIAENGLPSKPRATIEQRNYCYGTRQWRNNYPSGADLRMTPSKFLP
jgi:hypothetical protein